MEAAYDRQRRQALPGQDGPGPLDGVERAGHQQLEVLAAAEGQLPGPLAIATAEDRVDR